MSQISHTGSLKKTNSSAMMRNQSGNTLEPVERGCKREESLSKIGLISTGNRSKIVGMVLLAAFAFMLVLVTTPSADILSVEITKKPDMKHVTTSSAAQMSSPERNDLTGTSAVSSSLRVSDSRRSMASTHDRKLVHKGFIDGVEYLWQLPEVEEVKAIFFAAHGCKHSATDWFPKDEKNCKQCLGLPEEMAIVQIARERGMLVLAASSKDRFKKCWNSGDGSRVAKILTKLQKDNQLHKDIPIYGMGSSSGAQMVGSYMPKSVPSLSGVISQNKVPNEKYDLHIPAAYIALPQDDTKSLVKAFANEQRKGPSKFMELSPFVIDTNFFHERIDGISLSTSQQLHDLMLKDKLLDSQGLLRKDPRSTRPIWSFTFRSLVKDDSFIPDESNVFEVLNVAYGHHQTARDGVAEALDWLILQYQQSQAKSGS